MRRCFALVLLCLMALPILAVHAQPAEPVFEPGPCPVRFSGSTRVECGTVSVPQDRSNPDGLSIRLAVAVLKSRAAEPAADPLIFLDGGPGARTLDSYSQGLGPFMSQLVDHRDVVIFDYRGMGYSIPALTCPESAGRADIGWIMECKARHEAAGVDVTDYTTVENSADAAEIMRALGYDSYNVWGGSYGSSVAQALLRDHPDGIRAALITALQALQGDLQSTRPEYLFRTVDSISAICQADAGCAAAFPGDLREQLYDIITRLQNEPVTVETASGTGQIDGLTVLGVLSEMLKDEQFVPRVPGFIALLQSGDTSALEPYAVNLLTPSGDPERNPIGAWLSMRCTDSILLPTETDMERILAGVPAVVQEPIRTAHQFQRDECAAWGARRPTREDRLPAETDIPVLIISGALDPFSSQEWLDSTLATLPNGYGYMLPYYAHFVVQNSCVASMLLGFVDDPETPPDASCMADIPAPTFQTP